jgi:hypothetical protein
MLPRSVGEIGRKGIAKFCRVLTVGCHEQSDLNCTGCKPSIAGRATTESMVRQRIVRQKPLYLETRPLKGWMERRGLRTEPVGLYVSFW